MALRTPTRDEVLAAFDLLPDGTPLDLNTLAREQRMNHVSLRGFASKGDVVETVGKRAERAEFPDAPRWKTPAQDRFRVSGPATLRVVEALAAEGLLAITTGEAEGFAFRGMQDSHTVVCTAALLHAKRNDVVTTRNEARLNEAEKKARRALAEKYADEFKALVDAAFEPTPLPHPDAPATSRGL